MVGLASLLVTLAISLQRQPPVAVSTPESSIKSFYTWYLSELAKDRYPLIDGREKLKSFVAPELLAEIDKQRNSQNAPDADYFLQAQDYLDEWIGDIAATKLDTLQNRVRVRVLLGGKTNKLHALLVTLWLVRNTWFVRSVEQEVLQ